MLAVTNTVKFTFSASSISKSIVVCISHPCYNDTRQKKSAPASHSSALFDQAGFYRTTEPTSVKKYTRRNAGAQSPTYAQEDPPTCESCRTWGDRCIPDKEMPLTVW